jgi:hypothetical protein
MMTCSKSWTQLAIFALYLTSAAFSASAVPMSVSVTVSNSEGTTSENVELENANYGSSITLLPYTGFADFPSSIMSTGSGASTGPQGAFSHYISSSHNGESSKEVGASVETDSGSFRWSKSVYSSSDDISMGMGIGTSIRNGILDASYYNSDSEASKDMLMVGGSYRDTTRISPESLISKGSGYSLDDTNGKIGSWFSSRIGSESKGKEIAMVSNLDELVYTEADQKLFDDIRLLPDEAFASQTLEILSNNKCKLQTGNSENPTLPETSFASIHAGMKFKSTFSDTGKDVFEMRTVPDGKSYMLIYAIPLPGITNIVKMYDTYTFYQGAKWS